MLKGFVDRALSCPAPVRSTEQGTILDSYVVLTHTARAVIATTRIGVIRRDRNAFTGVSFADSTGRVCSQLSGQDHYRFVTRGGEKW